MTLKQELANGFRRLAMRAGLDLHQGPFGEWTNPETRQAWQFWIAGWQRRAAVDRKRTIRKSRRNGRIASVSQGPFGP
jgi:hypothetical protein